jgi:hypothetical protein
MTIMLAGGLTFAVPGVMPEAMAANANLYVSAENSQYSNYMTGPQVVEVVVIDSDINETDQANGEPDVTINGKKLRMAQATDGNWYGYFADKAMAAIADQTLEDNSVDAGYGIDFGQFCGPTSTALTTDGTALFSDTIAVALPIRSDTTANTFGVNGTSTIAACTTSFNGNAIVVANSTHTNTSATGPVAGAAGTASAATAGQVSNVVREAKAINQNSNTGNGIGQLNLKDDGLWPFVQLYNFAAGGDVIIKYQKAGGVQTTTLTFDTVDASESLDRTKYPQGSQVHFTINDVWLNIDPTDEDSWTFETYGSNGYKIYYQLFDENGSTAGDGNSSPNLNQKLSDLMAEEGVLKLDINTQGASTAAVFIQDNDDVVYSSACADGMAANVCDTSGGSISNGQPVTVVETQPASGVFVTYDESDKSQLAINNGAIRGTSGTITYADGHSILVGNDFATISIDPVDDTWNSGEEIPVVLVDQDQNKNSRADEDLTVKSYTSSRLIPALETGDPFTIGENGTGTGTTAKAVFGDFSDSGNGAIQLLRTVSSTVTVSKYSEVALLDPTASSSQAGTDSIGIDFNVKMSELQATVKDTRSSANAARLLGTSLLNLDVSGFNSTGSFDVYLVNATTQIVADGSGAFNLSTGSLKIADNVDPKSLTVVNGTAASNSNSTKTSIEAISDVALPATKYVGMVIHHQSDTTNVILNADSAIPIVADFFSFGFTATVDRPHAVRG